MNLVKYFLSIICIMLFAAVAVAQVSKDSLQSLRQQKQSLELSTKINELKMKLAKLENTLDNKTRELDGTTESARQAANDNSTAAGKLADDPQNKKLARHAESSGDNAKKSAKRARVATDDMSDLKKDIEALKSKIIKDEAKLAFNPVTSPAQQ
jgi:hypothetical protein